MNEYELQKLDEVLLLDKQFEYGLSGTTLWRKDKNNQDWCAVLDQPSEYILWYPVLPSGGLGVSRTMTRTNFEELFA